MNVVLPKLAQSYVDAVNDRDPATYLNLFAADAVVEDAGRTLRGRDEIAAWAASDIYAVNVTLDVTAAAERDGATEITTRVDGTFDRTGLPDPVVIVHRLESTAGKITRLTCRLA